MNELSKLTYRRAKLETLISFLQKEDSEWLHSVSKKQMLVIAKKMLQVACSKIQQYGTPAPSTPKPYEA